MTYLVKMLLVALGIGGATAVAVYLAGKFWDDISDRVAAWLRARGLAASALMDAWIQLDLSVRTVRTRIYGKQSNDIPTLITETTFNMSEIDDPDVLAELERRGCATRNIMSLVHER